MSRNARIGVLVLVILTGLPVSGTVCAFVCQPPPHGAARTSAHHGDADCAQPSPSNIAGQIGSASSHDCRSHTLTAPQPATFAPERVSGTVPPASMPAVVEQTRTGADISSWLFAQRTARGTPPLLAPTIVLRV